VLAVKDDREDAVAACGGLSILDRCARRVGERPAGNPACEVWRLLMATRQRIVRSLNTRSTSGAIGVAETKFSTGWSSATGSLISDDLLVETALKIVSGNLVRGDVLQSPSATRQYLSLRFANLEHEVFSCLWLDNRHRVIACEEMFRGTIDGASVHPREVVKRALAQNAAAVILAHNHPSGVAEPSQADELITQRLRDALAIVDIRLLDHLIVAGARVVSMAERGAI